MMAMRPVCEARPAPSRMEARRASFRAVRGRARTNGWMTAGKRSEEKKIPENTNIGSITRFMRPETVSIFEVRLATRRPMPEKENPPSSASSAIDPIEPCTTMWKTSRPKTSSIASCRKTTLIRLVIMAARKSVRRIGVAISRLRSLRERISTSTKPTPHIPPLMMFMPSMPGIRKSM